MVEAPIRYNVCVVCGVFTVWFAVSYVLYWCWMHCVEYIVLYQLVEKLFISLFFLTLLIYCKNTHFEVENKIYLLLSIDFTYCVTNFLVCKSLLTPFHIPSMSFDCVIYWWIYGNVIFLFDSLGKSLWFSCFFSSYESFFCEFLLFWWCFHEICVRNRYYYFYTLWW